MQKRLAGKLVKECAENIDETRLVEIISAKNENKHRCSSCCTLFYFQHFLQLTLEVVAIFFVFTGTSKKGCYLC